MQEILIFLIFLAAVAYLARMFWLQAKGKQPACAKGCGGCSTINPDLLEKKIRAAERK